MQWFLIQQNAFCLLARLLMIWISFFSLPIFLHHIHTHTHLCFLPAFFPGVCSPLAQLASVDYSSLTAIMILHKQRLSAHLSLSPPSGCPLSSTHLCSISAAVPLGWKCTLPSQLKITPKVPFDICANLQMSTVIINARLSLENPLCPL